MSIATIRQRQNNLLVYPSAPLLVFRFVNYSAHMTSVIFFAFLLFSAPPALAANEAASQAHEQGRKIYNFRCYYCHGYSGDARTLASRFLTPPPRDFTQMQAQLSKRDSMISSVHEGHPNTAMAGFANILTPQEIAQVVDFVRNEFIIEKKENTRYHTLENGWPNHQRYRIAFPFATGEIALDENPENLSATQIKGRQLFLDTCISCHDRARVHDEGPVWEASAVSYPRTNSVLDYRKLDSVSEASVYARHDIAPVLDSANKRVKKGEQLFQDNCAFCHGADGTGKNWIGSFLQPHPRDLTDTNIMQSMSAARLRQVIEEGLVDTSMPAWKEVLKKTEIDALISYIHVAFHPLPGYRQE